MADSSSLQRFLCDEMLAGLARWLRAAGHDAAVAPRGTADALVLARAGAEGRCLLTRDRGLMQHANAAGIVLLLERDTLEEQALELRRRLHLDWMAAPLTRCLLCNVPLVSAGSAAVSRLPDHAKRLEGPFYECPACRRLYWPGSHTRRMTARLKQWTSP